MKISKQQRQVFVLSGLLAVLAFTLYQWFAGSAGSSGTTPAVVQNLEAQRIATNLDVVERRQRERVVTAAAHHAAQSVSNAPEDEVLLVHTGAESDPRTDHVAGRQRVLPGSWLQPPPACPERSRGACRRGLRRPC